MNGRFASLTRQRRAVLQVLGLALLSGTLALLPACQRSAEPAAPAAPAAKAEAKHDDLQKAIEAPQDKAKAIEQPLLDSQNKVDQAMEQEQQGEADGS